MTLDRLPGAPARAPACGGASRAVALLALLSSGCCCSGDFLRPPEVALPSDEPAIEATARAYVEQHRSAIFASPDAGRGGGECSAAAAAGLALDLGAAVLTRGHAGSSPAGRVVFNPAACARRIEVFVVKQAALWTVVGIVVYHRATGARLLSMGAPPSDFVRVADSDDAIDELFD